MIFILFILIGCCFRINESRGLKSSKYQFTDDYSIGSTSVNTSDPGLSDGILAISNEIGSLVEAYNASVILLDHDCNMMKPKTGLEIEILNDEYVDTSAPFTYDIAVNKELILISPGEFVDLVNTNETNTSQVSETIKGNLCFCTRVSTFEEGLQVRSLDSWFNVTFKLKEDDFNITRLSINKHWFDFDLEYVKSDAHICQCDVDFSCLDKTEPISRGEEIAVCLDPFAEGYINFLSIEISNFNMRMVSSDSNVTYVPVKLGTSSWDPDSFTEVTSDSESNKIKVRTTIADEFYDALDETNTIGFINLEGIYFLEIKETNSESSVKKGFALSVNITDQGREAEPISDGCFSRLFSLIGVFFR